MDVASRTIRLNTSLFWASLPASVGLKGSHFFMSSVHLLVGRPFLLLPSSLASSVCLSRERLHSWVSWQWSLPVVCHCLLGTQCTYCTCVLAIVYLRSSAHDCKKKGRFWSLSYRPLSSSTSCFQGFIVTLT